MLDESVIRVCHQFKKISTVIKSDSYLSPTYVPNIGPMIPTFINMICHLEYNITEDASRTFWMEKSTGFTLILLSCVDAALENMLHISLSIKFVSIRAFLSEFLDKVNSEA